MEERPATEFRDEIDPGKYFAFPRKVWWKIGLLSLGVGLLTLILMFLRPNIYQATAIITPAIEDKKENPAFGALASFGVNVGGASKVEDLDSLFKSNDLTVRVFRKYNLWPVLLKDRYDPATGNIRRSWTDRFLGGGKGPKRPGDWDAIREARNRMKVFVNRRADSLSISFESTSPEGSAGILNHYLEEGKSRLQEEAFERAEKNKKFIQEQIGKTVDALTRDRLYTMYGQEVEREMMARNREQFGFRIIDSARIPDRKAKPQRAKTAVLATILAFPALAILFGYLGRRRETHPPVPGSERSAG